MRILIADDDAITRGILAGTLPKWGYPIACASDGCEALEMAAKDPNPSLIILDWMMPKIDGLELCRRLKEQSTSAPHYIILLTARNDPSEVVQGLEAGADDYLIKPFNLDELRARLQVGCRFLQLHAKLQEEHRLKGVLEMAGAVCHQMNQPLQAVLISSQLLLQNLSPQDPNYELLSSIQSAIEQLGAVTRKVMSITHSRTSNYLHAGRQITNLSLTH